MLLRIPSGLFKFDANNQLSFTIFSSLLCCEQLLFWLLWLQKINHNNYCELTVALKQVFKAFKVRELVNVSFNNFREALPVNIVNNQVYILHLWDNMWLTNRLWRVYNLFWPEIFSANILDLLIFCFYFSSSPDGYFFIYPTFEIRIFVLYFTF